MKQSKHNIIYVLVNVLSILIVAFLPLHIFAVSYRTSKAGFNYQIISGYNVRIGYHTENGSSISYTNAPTAITEKTKMNLVIPELIDDYYTPIEIDSYSFNESSLRSVVLPNTITKIGDTAFSNSLNLAIINIPGSVTNLGNAFSGCKNLRHIISGIENPTSCWSAFNNIATDAHLYVPVGTLSKYKSTGGWMKISNIAEIPGDIFFHDDPAGIVEYLIDSEKNNEVQLGVGSFNAIPLDINSYTIPTSVERDKSVFYVNTIGANAFKDCSNLEVIRMHKNIVHVNNAFSGCSSLGSVYVEWRNPSDIEFESNCFDGIPENVSLYVPAGTKDKYEALAVFNRFSQIVENSPLSIGDVASVIGSQTNLPIILNSEEVISGIQCKLTLPEGVSLVEEEGEPVVSLTNRTEGFTVMGHKDPDAENSYLFVMFSLEGTPITGNKGAIMNVKLNVPSDVELGKYDMIIEDITLATSTFNTLYPATVNSELLIESNVRNIDFADANVKAICVSNWDVNHDGELDADEAASVTNLNNAFKGNTNITSFDELQYFTGLTSIPSYAFNGCNKLLAITIPNSVTSIGKSAFESSSELRSITIPNSVKYIGESAFYRCWKLASIVIPNGVISIGKDAFRNCNVLASITIGNSVTSISKSAFVDCNALTSIKVESSNPKFDSRDGCNAIIETSSNTLFMGFGCTTIPNSVTVIGDSAFAYCRSLTSVTIPNSVTTIKEHAFSCCFELTSVTIPNSVTFIGDNAFHYCDIQSIIIPNSITSIGSDVFSSCDRLSSVSIPNSVTSIGDNAFSGCRSLTSITIPEGVTSIGESAFAYCRDLTSVTIPSSVSSIGEKVFDDCGLMFLTSLKTDPTSIPDNVFDSEAYATMTLYVPEGCIDKYKGTEGWDNFQNYLEGTAPAFVEFEVNNIRYILNSPNSVKVTYNIGQPYEGNVTIPASVTYGGYTFSVTEIGQWAFNNMVGASSFTDNSNLISVIIPNSVTSISRSAFEWCSGLGSIKIENGNPKYDSRDDCNAIIETSTNTLLIGCKGSFIPNSVTSIGESAFEDVSELRSVIIPGSVTSIGNYAFRGCSLLSYVIVDKAQPISIDASVFSNRANATLIVPDGSKASYEAHI